MYKDYQDSFFKIGLKIQYYRKLRGYTQEEFAELIDKSWSFVAKIESQSITKGISLETLFKISDVLDIEPSMLLKDI